MAITHEVSNFANTGGATSLTISGHRIQGTDPVLVVKVALKSSSFTVTGVKWDPAGVNESLIQLNTDINGNARADIWYLANGTAKTADITISFSSTVRAVGGATTYSDVDQTNPFRVAANSSGNGTDASPTVDVVALNTEMVVDSLAQVSAGPDTATKSHTNERHNDAGVGSGTDTRGASQEHLSSGATDTMSWSMGGSENWAICAGALQEPQAAVPEVASYMPMHEEPPTERWGAVGY